jgi:hypothetical protein
MNISRGFFWVLTTLVSLYTLYALVIASWVFLQPEPGADPAPYLGYLFIAAFGWIIVGIVFLLGRRSKLFDRNY